MNQGFFFYVWPESSFSPGKSCQSHTWFRFSSFMYGPNPLSPRETPAKAIHGSGFLLSCMALALFLPWKLPPKPYMDQGFFFHVWLEPSFFPGNSRHSHTWIRVSSFMYGSSPLSSLETPAKAIHGSGFPFSCMAEGISSIRKQAGLLDHISETVFLPPLPPERAKIPIKERSLRWMI